jgi:hypothetical protein
MVVLPAPGFPGQIDQKAVLQGLGQHQRPGGAIRQDHGVAGCRRPEPELAEGARFEALPGGEEPVAGREVLKIHGAPGLRDKLPAPRAAHLHGLHEEVDGPEPRGGAAREPDLGHGRSLGGASRGVVGVPAAAQEERQDGQKASGLGHG